MALNLLFFRTSGNVSGPGMRSTPCGIKITFFILSSQRVPWHVFDRLRGFARERCGDAPAVARNQFIPPDGDLVTIAER